MDEKTLVRLSLEGNNDAFEELVKKYKAKMVNLAFSMTHNRENADDLAQDVFIKAYSALKKFRFQSEFGTWIYRIALNHIKDFLRTENKVVKVPFEERYKDVGKQDDEMMKRERDSVQEKRRHLVHDGIRALPEKYQTILSLRDIQGFSYEEIGQILNLTPGTVDSRLHRARRLLRTKIAPFLS
ncbi:MAG: RNA polymerase sigma factor [Candidatus Aminicenantes bacterium]|nr:RNA polymerase sigma factor [Candidatus Aminicenantes bacterium]